MWFRSDLPPPLEQISHSLLLAFRYTARHCIGHCTLLSYVSYTALHFTALHWAMHSSAHCNLTHKNIDTAMHTTLHCHLMHCIWHTAMLMPHCIFHTAHCNLMSTLLNAPSMGHHSIELMPLSCTTLAHCKVYTVSKSTLPSMQMRCTMK